MKIKFLLSFLLVCALGMSAQNQGYKDGIEYYKAGQLENARTILERTLNDATTDKALANYYLGEVALEQGNKDQAEHYFSTGLQLDPNNAFCHVGMGALALLNGQANVAADEFKTAQNLAKKNAEISVAIARAYYNANPVTYAVQIDKALVKARKDSRNANPDIYILEGDMLAAQGNYGDAAGRYEMAINYDPSNPEGYVKFANAYFYVNKDFAIRKLEEYHAAHPESAMVQRELAEKYFQADRWRAASELYGQYIQNPNHFPEDKARYAVLLYWGEQYPASLAIAEEILAQDPSNFLMQRVRFLDQTAMGQHQEAADNARLFFESNPGAAFTIKDYTTYAEALTGLGQDSLAVIQYEIAAEKYPENADLQKNLSSMYSSVRRFDRSAEAYDRYLQLKENPTLSDFFGMSARYLNAAAVAEDSVVAQDMATRGIEYINRVIEGTSEVTPEMYRQLGRLHVAKNNKRPDADAVAAYEQLVALLDRDPENLNPANPNNALKLYWEAYAFQQAYSSIIKDNEANAEWGRKIREINELIEQANANQSAQ